MKYLITFTDERFLIIDGRREVDNIVFQDTLNKVTGVYELGKKFNITKTFKAMWEVKE